jgi:hypothetical protein
MHSTADVKNGETNTAKFGRSNLGLNYER